MKILKACWSHSRRLWWFQSTSTLTAMVNCCSLQSGTAPQPLLWNRDRMPLIWQLIMNWTALLLTTAPAIKTPASYAILMAPPLVWIISSAAAIRLKVWPVWWITTSMFGRSNQLVQPSTKQSTCALKLPNLFRVKFGLPVWMCSTTLPPLMLEQALGSAVLLAQWNVVVLTPTNRKNWQDNRQKLWTRSWAWMLILSVWWKLKTNIRDNLMMNRW